MADAIHSAWRASVKRRRNVSAPCLGSPGAGDGSGGDTHAELNSQEHEEEMAYWRSITTPAMSCIPTSQPMGLDCSERLTSLEQAEHAMWNTLLWQPMCHDPLDEVWDAIVAPAMPAMRGKPQKHRAKRQHWPLFNAAVARPVGKAEIARDPKAKGALKKEWDKLLNPLRPAWRMDLVRPWAEVAREAKAKNEKVHVGNVFGLCVEKGSELADGDPDRLFKGRYVFQGNKVKDEDAKAAVFNELSSSPASLESSKCVDAYGLMPGHDIQQADAESAYTQASLGDEDALLDKGMDCVKTWVRLPPKFRPDSWANIIDPVCPLDVALYGHPEAGGWWERHCNKIVTEAGFKPISNWSSLYWHEELKLMMWVYVDDFRIGGPKENLPKGWALLNKIKMDAPKPAGKCMGCLHRQGVAEVNGKKVRTMEYDMTDFMGSCVTAYQKASGATPGDLAHASTPFAPQLGEDTGKGKRAEHGASYYDEQSNEAVYSALVDGGPESGQLDGIASAMLMKLLYGARIARWDLLKCISLLAARVTKWTRGCDVALHRLMCYVNSTKDLVLGGHVGDVIKDVGLVLYADADWAGDRPTFKSTSGCIEFLGGRTLCFRWRRGRGSRRPPPTAPQRLRLPPRIRPCVWPAFPPLTCGTAWPGVR